MLCRGVHALDLGSSMILTRLFSSVLCPGPGCWMPRYLARIAILLLVALHVHGILPDGGDLLHVHLRGMAFCI